MNLCKLGIHKWPTKGIRNWDDWFEHIYDEKKEECIYNEEEVELITEDEENEKIMYFICKCLRCGKRELRRIPHNYLQFKFYSLWKKFDFFTFVDFQKDKHIEIHRGDFNAILETSYRLWFCNFEFSVTTKPIEMHPGKLFDIYPEGHRDITPEEYKEKYGYFPLDSKEYQQEQKDKQSG